MRLAGRPRPGLDEGRGGGRGGRRKWGGAWYRRIKEWSGAEDGTEVAVEGGIEKEKIKGAGSVQERTICRRCDGDGREIA